MCMWFLSCVVVSCKWHPFSPNSGSSVSEGPSSYSGKVSQLEALVKMLQEDLKKVSRTYTIFIIASLTYSGLNKSGIIDSHLLKTNAHLWWGPLLEFQGPWFCFYWSPPPVEVIVRGCRLKCEPSGIVSTFPSLMMALLVVVMHQQCVKHSFSTIQTDCSQLFCFYYGNHM